MSRKPFVLLKSMIAAGALVSVSGCVTREVIVERPPAGEEVVVAQPAGAPPPAPQEVIVASPGPQYVWVGGAYEWRGGGWVWVPGRWAMPVHAHAVWVEGHWHRVRGGYAWTPGHWR